MKKVRDLFRRMWPDDRPYTRYTFVHPDDPEYDCGDEPEYSYEYDEQPILSISDEEYQELMRLLDEDSPRRVSVKPLNRRWERCKPYRKNSWKQ